MTGAVPAVLAAALRDRLAAGAPSAVARVERLDGALLAEGAAGVLDRASGRPLAPGHALRAASVTKAVTAATVVRLHHDGRLDLDEPVARHLPAHLVDRLHVRDGVSRGDRITARMLLAHTAGLPDHLTDERFTARLAADPRRPWAPEELVEAAIELGPPPFAPGAGFAYSDAGYVVAGLLVQAVTGGALHDAYRHLVLGPAGMDDTWLEGHEAPRGPQAAHHEAGEQDMTRVTPTFDWGGGGLVTTTADLARFARARWTGALAGLAEMTAWTPGVRFAPGAAARYERYGLGIGTTRVGGAELVGVTGSWGAFVYVDPAAGAVLTGTLNAFGVDRGPLVEAALAVAREET